MINNQPCKLESEDPESIYNWLDSFDSSLKIQNIGKSYDYPLSKYQRSKAINSSIGYHNTVYIHKQHKSYKY